MISFLIIFLASIIFSFGIIVSRKQFYALAENALSLLDGMLNNQIEDNEKQRLLISKTARVIFHGSLFYILLLLFVAIAAILVLAFEKHNGAIANQNGFIVLIAGLVGGILPFFLFQQYRKKKTANYSELSMLLHRIILNNYAVSKQLHKWEKKGQKKDYKKDKDDFVVVSGLARSGTTALTMLLAASNKFHFLNYANMPFLLSPNIWKKVSSIGRGKKRERSHGDKIMIDNYSVEALEEYFFKVFLNDTYIQNEALLEHEIDNKTYQNYIEYQNVVKNKKNKDSVYLAKNNNLLLRYRSLREKNSSFKAVFMIRQPIDHANSLMQQHLRFCKIQEEDPFVLEYMNWLGHHEFGLNHKQFSFNSKNNKGSFNPSSINYWLEIWINYYSYLLEFKNDDHTILINYKDFLEAPQIVLQKIESRLNLKLSPPSIQKFENNNSYAGKVDATLEAKANAIYSELLTI